MPKTILTCAVTGGDDVAHKFKQLPVTPRQIAEAVLDAAKAGAAVAHIHVRDPETGKPSMELDLYREVVDIIRASETDVVINLTTGPGARFVPSLESTNGFAAGSNVRPPEDRVRHVVALKPEICSLDMGSLNFGKGALINTPSQIEAIAARIKDAGVKPELEIFDAGHLALALKMMADGIVPADAFFQFALGIPWGAPATAEMVSYLKTALPKGSQWAAFGVGRTEFPMVAQSLLMGGHARVGMEDNFYLAKGVEAHSNAQLVEKAVNIIQSLGGEVATPAEAREMLGLRKQ
ncbi:3-keto-5-aminohexanoate cleavage protein [Sinorhizobium meliloti]|uniref:3-keto-5-aminohexanoate cleavage protein n=1 Tax=Rhizobium meliloti TaxID=382 RepID=UPI0018E7F23C|nr:3-keto-5-aminohexanoate cleavage protein [Sinorhizobium meliloti]MDW9610857.1 3-keto-5-aminohexanoate cleavage protein [Sinorhizobium meliloti]MDW9835951.1 3-keto-5-aminohexanoate cleavage protein [Sinorhizobium meliloti]MDX0040360.1 3-keto-5-aminohexanoate cleavage protein [Sinorhizobium meliloti]MDX0088882.1 3-keto-5-aminohexanoate cleavage protein [Sinorhizobium meliloti]QQF06190.1 3-keto-5-aminohexanoate cleavage protein [Sinorhizobium meliloti]